MTSPPRRASSITSAPAETSTGPAASAEGSASSTGGPVAASSASSSPAAGLRRPPSRAAPVPRSLSRGAPAAGSGDRPLLAQPGDLGHQLVGVDRPRGEDPTGRHHPHRRLGRPPGRRLVLDHRGRVEPRLQLDVHLVESALHGLDVDQQLDSLLVEDTDLFRRRLRRQATLLHQPAALLLRLPDHPLGFGASALHLGFGVLAGGAGEPQRVALCPGSDEQRVLGGFGDERGGVGVGPLDHGRRRPPRPPRVAPRPGRLASARIRSASAAEDDRCSAVSSWARERNSAASGLRLEPAGTGISLCVGAPPGGVLLGAPPHLGRRPAGVLEDGAHLGGHPGQLLSEVGHVVDPELAQPRLEPGDRPGQLLDGLARPRRGTAPPRPGRSHADPPRTGVAGCRRG